MKNKQITNLLELYNLVETVQMQRRRCAVTPGYWRKRCRCKAREADKPQHTSVCEDLEANTTMQMRRFRLISHEVTATGKSEIPLIGGAGGLDRSVVRRTTLRASPQCLK